MNTNAGEWLSHGRGLTPRLTWSLSTDAPLAALQLARETGHVLAVDEIGTMYVIDPSGQLANLTRGLSPLRALSWADTGVGGAALVGEDRLYWFDQHLKFQWHLELAEPTLTLALDGHGHYAAVSLDSGRNVLYDTNRTMLRRFQTVQPLIALEFLAATPALLGVAEYGLLCCYGFDGRVRWEEKLWANVGDMAVTGDGRTVLLACFSHGIQCHDDSGNQRGSYQLGGTVCKVATSFVPGAIAAATIEHHFYWLTPDGRITWQAVLPEDLTRLLCDPLGRGVILGFKSGQITRLDWGVL